MNNKRKQSDIAASLAREFALDETRLDASDPDLSASEIDGIRRDVGEFAERVINFLLCNHYIVNKDLISAKYSEARERYFNPDNETEEIKRMEIAGYGSRISLLEYLFPDIVNDNGNPND